MSPVSPTSPRAHQDGPIKTGPSSRAHHHEPIITSIGGAPRQLPLVIAAPILRDLAECGSPAHGRVYRRRPLAQAGPGTGGVACEASAQIVSSGVWRICS